MKSVILSPKYQVVIPKEIREKHGFSPGQSFEVIDLGNRIELVPVKPLKQYRGFLKGYELEIEREGDRL